MDIITGFFVAIALNGAEITEVGPFGSPTSCFQMRDSIRSDINRDFEPGGTLIYGINGDMWGQNGIFFYDDYNIRCVAIRYDVENQMVLGREYF